jgi:anti-sigma factor RsiW
MSACLKKEAWLAFLDRELAAGEMESAEKHVADCSSCQQQLESIRSTSREVNALLSSLAPHDAASAESIVVVRVPYDVATSGMRWAAVASVGVLAAAAVLFAMVRRPHVVAPPTEAKAAAPAPVTGSEKKEVVVATVEKPAPVGAHKVHTRVRQFQALDSGAPIETGMIYRVSLPASSSPDASATQSAKRIPAEVIVDEFGKVRAIRFLQ